MRSRLLSCRRSRPGTIAATVLLAALAACAQPVAGTPIAAAAPLLPGAERLSQGTSSFLFGINESFDWSGVNLENTPRAQQTLKQTGFTLIRTFFSEQHLGWPFHKGPTTDADLELRFAAIEKSGAQCLGVLSVSDDRQFDSSVKFLDHVISYAETSKPGTVRCRLWEYGNEYGNMSTYLKRWNTDVKYLRARHPDARFIGPVIAGPYTDQIQQFLDGTKSSSVLPDGISYHDYPCYKSPDYADTAADAAACDALINPRYADTIRTVKGAVRATLGKDLPVGITEWNVSPNFVNLVGGKLPLTASPTYQPHFIREIFDAMRSSKLDFAALYDAMDGGGIGTAGSLDLIDTEGNPRPWISAYKSEIATARRG